MVHEETSVTWDVEESDTLSVEVGTESERRETHIETMEVVRESIASELVGASRPSRESIASKADQSSFWHRLLQLGQEWQSAAHPAYHAPELG